MFDKVLPEPDVLSEVDDAALAASIAGWASVANAAEARRLAAIAELTWRRCVDEEQHPMWACDDWDACAAEVGAALICGHAWARVQMDLAMALRERLPRVGAKFLEGKLAARTVASVCARTSLVTDPAALAELDQLIAEEATRWGPLSKEKLDAAVDASVACVDPMAVRRSRRRSRDRDFVIGDPNNDETGTTSVWGRLSTPHAALLGSAIDALAGSVCENDPRTVGQRRADAVGALAAHASRLGCLCGDGKCPAAGEDEVAARFVVHILADAAALRDRPDPAFHGDPSVATRDRLDESDEPDQPDEPDGGDFSDGSGGHGPDRTGPDGDSGGGAAVSTEDAHGGSVAERDGSASVPRSAVPPDRRAAAIIPNMPNGVIPAPLLAELIAGGAKIRFVGAPDGAPEKRYRPSAALAEFVRIRDLTCRYPGCDRPAWAGDIDHTIPWPAGPTHPSNTKAYCRTHHLVKTFWPGFNDEQSPDGTVRVSVPSGLSYATKPIVTLLFPGFDPATAALPPPPASVDPPKPGRTLKMPTRKRSRAQARADRIRAERARNEIEPPF